MLLIIALILLLAFGGLGFAAHILWWGLIIGLILLVAHAVSGGGGPYNRW